MYFYLKGAAMITSFSKETQNKLRSYVYTYTDPRNGKVFYVGKGERNRCFAHLGRSEDEFRARLDAIHATGLEPLIDILASGLDENDALAIEAAVIETYGIGNLLNKARGKEVRKKSVEDIERENTHDKIDVDNLLHSVLRISITTTYPTIDPHDSFALYEITRACWSFDHGPKAALDASLVPYALASYYDRVMEVYKVKGWYDCNDIMHSKRHYRDKGSGKRWAFVGNIAEEPVRKLYVNKLLPPRAQGDANPLKLYLAK
ncbi:MAG: hypothetical protein LBP24_01820 [Coriobacteriales bacterium]|nr:hypothetical protein [Coriobacteriales bacterium]